MLPVTTVQVSLRNVEARSSPHFTLFHFIFIHLYLSLAMAVAELFGKIKKNVKNVLTRCLEGKFLRLGAKSGRHN